MSKINNSDKRKIKDIVSLINKIKIHSDGPNSDTGYSLSLSDYKNTIGKHFDSTAGFENFMSENSEVFDLYGLKIGVSTLINYNGRGGKIVIDEW